MTDKHLYISSLFGGGAAGLVVDIALFPLDTLKTRLQSAEGFWKSGGFNGVYKGIGPQTVGSVPQGAIFFMTYDALKAATIPNFPSKYHPVLHMASASIAETVSGKITCFIRVPVEVVKQRRQTSTNLPKDRQTSSLRIIVHAYKSEGIWGLYRGFASTLLRDVPFSLIQFPIFEYLKKVYSARFKMNKQLQSFEVGICGSIAGGITAAVTTPMDVIKTRIMLAPRADKSAVLHTSDMFYTVYREHGIRGFFAGFVPRVLWITIGGYVFFGMYDLSKNWCNNFLEQKKT